MSLIVYVVQLLLVAPCAWLAMPLAPWLSRELGWATWPAVAVTTAMGVLSWIALIMLLTFFLKYILGAENNR